MRVVRWSLQSAVSLVVALVGGCVPPVGHGPRVEPGGRWFLSGGFVHAPEIQGEQMTVWPSLFAGGGNGWVTASGLAVSFGVQIPVLLFPLALFDADEPLDRAAGLLLFDVYAQPQRTEAPTNHEFGVGVLGSTAVFMPYLQYGSGKDNGIYTTQGVVLTYRVFDGAMYWAPTVAIRDARPDGARAADFYVSALLGQVDAGTRTRTEWLVSVGVVAEIRRKR